MVAAENTIVQSQESSADDVQAQLKTTAQQGFRNYTDSKFQDRVERTYFNIQTLHTLADVQAKLADYRQLSKASMSVEEMMAFLDTIVDESDPDNDLPQSFHAYQTAESVLGRYFTDRQSLELKTVPLEMFFTNQEWRELPAQARQMYQGQTLASAFPHIQDWSWFPLIGLIHDLGKVCMEKDFGGMPQWSGVGDTFVLGCDFDPANIFSDKNFYSMNPDAEVPAFQGKLGIYQANCGFDKVIMSFGHDEYLALVLEGHAQDVRGRQERGEEGPVKQLPPQAPRVGWVATPHDALRELAPARQPVAMPAGVGGDERTRRQGCAAFWAACCSERVLSPLLVVCIHATIVAVVAYHREPLLFAQGRREQAEWLLVFTTLGCYLRTSLTDPGWLPAPRPSERLFGCQAFLFGCCCCCCCRCALCERSGDRARKAPIADTELPSTAGQQGLDEEEGVALAAAPQNLDAPSGAPETGRIQKRRGGNTDDGGADEEPPLQSGQELRWCNRCRLYQPLRTKHCRDCGRCVRTHDHHCPWVGTCVGENNRVIFIWFLALQSVELGAFFGEGVRGISIIEPSVALLVSLLVIAMFFLMVICLLMFHSFLMLSGLTTWEHSSRMRISYMKTISIDRVSPFSRSVFFNAKTYCCGPRWCPGPLRRMAALRYDEEGGVIWEIVDAYQPCCLLRYCADTC